jgi:hypothetical protein
MSDYLWHEHKPWRGYSWEKKTYEAKNNDVLRSYNWKGSKEFLRIKHPVNII